MTNKEMYETIFESLQNDIDDGNISYEYGNIINNIAYDVYMGESQVTEEVEAILDRYISEATKEDDSYEDPDYTTEYVTYDPDTDHEAYIEAVRSFDCYDEAMNEFYEAAMDALDKITTAYEEHAISDDEMDNLMESINVKIDTYNAFMESGAIDSIKAKVKAWASAATAAAKEAKKGALGKTINEDTIKKSGAAAAAVIMALSQVGCDTSKIEQVSNTVSTEISANKEPEQYDKLIITINGAVTDINADVAKKISDNLKDMTNEDIKKYTNGRLEITVDDKTPSERDAELGITNKTRTVNIKTGHNGPVDLPGIVSKTTKIKKDFNADKIKEASAKAKKAEEDAKNAAAKAKAREQANKDK